jgi:hypothetical protein
VCDETAAVTSAGELGGWLICDLPDEYPHEWHYDLRDSVQWKAVPRGV